MIIFDYYLMSYNKTKPTINDTIEIPMDITNFRFIKYFNFV